MEHRFTKLDQENVASLSSRFFHDDRFYSLAYIDPRVRKECILGNGIGLWIVSWSIRRRWDAGHARGRVFQHAESALNGDEEGRGRNGRVAEEGNKELDIRAWSCKVTVKVHPFIVFVASFSDSFPTRSFQILIRLIQSCINTLLSALHHSYLPKRPAGRSSRYEIEKRKWKYNHDADPTENMAVPTNMAVSSVPSSPILLLPTLLNYLWKTARTILIVRSFPRMDSKKLR